MAKDDTFPLTDDFHLLEEETRRHKMTLGQLGGLMLFIGLVFCSIALIILAFTKRLSKSNIYGDNEETPPCLWKFHVDDLTKR